MRHTTETEQAELFDKMARRMMDAINLCWDDDGFLDDSNEFCANLLPGLVAKAGAWTDEDMLAVQTAEDDLGELLLMEVIRRVTAELIQAKAERYITRYRQAMLTDGRGI